MVLRLRASANYLKLVYRSSRQESSATGNWPKLCSASMAWGSIGVRGRSILLTAQKFFDTFINISIVSSVVPIFSCVLTNIFLQNKVTQLKFALDPSCWRTLATTSHINDPSCQTSSTLLPSPRGLYHHHYHKWFFLSHIPPGPLKCFSAPGYQILAKSAPQKVRNPDKAEFATKVPKSS